MSEKTNPKARVILGVVTSDEESVKTIRRSTSMRSRKKMTDPKPMSGSRDMKQNN